MRRDSRVKTRIVNFQSINGLKGGMNRVCLVEPAGLYLRPNKKRSKSIT